MSKKKWPTRFMRPDVPVKPHLLKQEKNIADIPGRPTAAWVDREHGWVVQAFDDCRGCDGTPWEGMLRVGVKHNLATVPEDWEKPTAVGTVTWDDLQAIKEFLWPGQIALEVYPPASQLVNVANMRWLWVLPPRTRLPFSLDARSPEKMFG